MEREPTQIEQTQIDQTKTGTRTPSPAAMRALKEAENRRAAQAGKASEAISEREIGGRGGLDPARFGDWEINGRAIDF